MNLTSLQNTPTVSSREIAELCGKRHDNVMADIRKMLDELDIYAPDFSGTFITEQGNQYECFNLPKRECLNLPKRECLILVSGYNVKIRTKIIDRWQQLEVDVSKFGGIYLDSMNLTLSMANFHSSKLSSAVETVSARELHTFLKVSKISLLGLKTAFQSTSSWKMRITCSPKRGSLKIKACRVKSSTC